MPRFISVSPEARLVRAIQAPYVRTPQCSIRIGTDTTCPAKLRASVKPERVNPLAILRMAIGAKGILVKLVDHLGPAGRPQPGAAFKRGAVEGTVIADRIVGFDRDV